MIDYTFSITSGAGGLAITPQLTVIRVVDGDRSPAFRQAAQLLLSIVSDVPTLEDEVEFYVRCSVLGMPHLSTWTKTDELCST